MFNWLIATAAAVNDACDSSHVQSSMFSQTLPDFPFTGDSYCSFVPSDNTHDNTVFTS